MNKEKSLSIAIMSVFALIMGGTVVTPALQSLAEAFPETPFSSILLVQTLPSLFLIPSTIIAGSIAGTKVKYKTLVIVGIILFVVAGAAPFFATSFFQILISRAIFGIGVGIISPLASALIINLFDGQIRANKLGAGNAFMMIGGIILQLLGGFLCSHHWRYTFLAHLLAVIPLVIVIFLLFEPPNIVQQEKTKAKLPIAVYVYSLIFGVSCILINTLPLNMSSIIISEKLGSPTSVGMVLSLFTIGGMVAGAFFGGIYKIANRFTVSIGMFVAAVGLGIGFYGNNLIMLTIACACAGMAFTILLPAVTTEVGNIVTPSCVGIATGMIMAAMNFGVFVAPYYISFVGKIFNPQENIIRFPIFVSMIILAVSGVIYALARLRNPPELSEIKS